MFNIRFLKNNDFDINFEIINFILKIDLYY